MAVGVDSPRQCSVLCPQMCNAHGAFFGTSRKHVILAGHGHHFGGSRWGNAPQLILQVSNLSLPSLHEVIQLADIRQQGARVALARNGGLSKQLLVAAAAALPCSGRGADPQAWRCRFHRHWQVAAQAGRLACKAPIPGEVLGQVLFGFHYASILHVLQGACQTNIRLPDHVTQKAHLVRERLHYSKVSGAAWTHGCLTEQSICLPVRRVRPLAPRRQAH
mmetsp:Transcript_131463/g.332031  ORF Transcript_131463/g.332031 Transcript_131463/m.332031 type:complete len:220 (+) Transcript_131463:250-909(+)